MRKHHVLLITFGLALAAMARADTDFEVVVNTSSLAGTTGSIDFQFNPGPGATQLGSMTIFNIFENGGSFAGLQQDFGSVSGGPVPNPLSFTSATADNEDFETFKFGPSLIFSVDLGGAAVDAPTGLSTASITGYFSIYSNTAGTIPALGSNPMGIAAEFIISPAGVISTELLSPAVNITPEPGSLWLVGGVLALMGAWSVRRRLFSR
jgi:hypothetical protein